VHHFNTIPFYIETGRLPPPETRVHSLLYVSTPCALPSRSGMAGIIGVAHLNNPREGLSGMLLWSDASFAQVLEGPADAVEAMFARIRRDARHRDVRPIARWARATRCFASDPMGLVRLSEPDCWRLLQRRTAPGDGGLGPWLFDLMMSARGAFPTA
jgi:hypothetical protein